MSQILPPISLINISMTTGSVISSLKMLGTTGFLTLYSILGSYSPRVKVTKLDSKYSAKSVPEKRVMPFFVISLGLLLTVLRFIAVSRPPQTAGNFLLASLNKSLRYFSFPFFRPVFN